MGTDLNRPPRGAIVRDFLEGHGGDPTGMGRPGAVEADPARAPVVAVGVEALVAGGVVEAGISGGRLLERGAAEEGVRRPPPVPGVASSTSSLTSTITLRRLRSVRGDSVRRDEEEPPRVGINLPLSA